MPLEQLNLTQNDLSEIKIEEVKNLLSKINDNSYLNDFNLDWDNTRLSDTERKILERLQEIENKKGFIETLISELEGESYFSKILRKSWWSAVENAIDIWSFTFKRGINIVNMVRNEKHILNDLEKYYWEIQNDYIRKYIEEEIAALKWGKKKDSWTTLLDTLVKQVEYNHESRSNSLLKRWHNLEQDSIIKNILWNEKKYNNLFIQWYSNKISNYLIKINDFEEYLSLDMTVIDTWDDWWNHNNNVVNSKAIWNYIEYILEKNWWDIYKTINNLKNIIWEQKITSLWSIWKNNENTIAQWILNKNPNGKLLIETVKNPNKVLNIEEWNNKLVYSIIEVWWNDFINELKTIIEENKDNNELKNKIERFLEIINSDDCPSSVKTKANIIIEMIEEWEVITEKWINNRVVELSSEWKWKVEGNIIQNLWLYASWWMSRMPSNESNFINTSSQIFSSTNQNSIDISRITWDFERDKEINLIEVINNLWNDDEEKIKNILEFIDNTDRISCWPIFWNQWIENIDLDTFYKELSNKLIDINNDKIKTKILDIVKIKWLSEEENQLIVDEVIKKIKWVDCNTELIKIISDTFKKYWIDYDFWDKKWLTDFIDIQINIEETIIKSETFWQQESDDEYLERIEEINRRRENNEVLRNANEEEFNELITNLRNWVDSKKAMNELNRKVKEREKIENIKNNTITINSNYTIENKNLLFKNNSWNSVSVTLSQNEQKLVKSNPEIIENIINFYNVLDRVWLSKLWDLKDSIFSSISNVEWIWFNIDWDYLNENEIKIFLNYILKSVWENQINNFLTLNDFIAQIEIKNNTQFSWNEAQIDMINWDTYLEDLFIKNFAPRNSAIFNSNLFENSLK